MKKQNVFFSPMYQNQLNKKISKTSNLKIPKAMKYTKED